MTNRSYLRVVVGAAVLAGAVGVTAYHATRDRAGAALDAGQATAPAPRREGPAPPSALQARMATTASESPPATTAPRPQPAPAPGEAASRTTDVPPSSEPRFDVLRLGANGTAVVAGRAAPGAEVLLLEAGRELGRATADRRGEWVILPEAPLPAGPRELSLRARTPGGDDVPGPDTVLVVGPALATPDASATPPPALVLLLPPTNGAPPRALSPPATPAPLGLEVVDYDDGDTMRFAGAAPPGARLRVYADGRHLGDTVADAAGRWSLTPAEALAVGRHSLRVDQLAAGEAARAPVAGRIQVAFQREALPAGLVREGRVVVQPGANLWRIARDTYGRGIRYTVIYRANQDQIRSPDRIFPGQVLSVPAAP